MATVGQSPQGTQAQVRAVAAANAKKPASLPKNRRREQSIPTQPGLWKLPPPRPPSRAPEVVAAEATEEVRRLEAAVSALGEGNAHLKPLLKALEVARARSHIEPVDKRIDSCKSFLERARKRAGRLEEVIARATTEKDVCLQEIVESERRLGQLEVQARVRPTQVDAQVEVSVGVLQEKIDVFCRRSGMFCWPQPPQFCRDQPQCGWEMVHLRWTTFLRCRAPMSGRGILVELPQLRDAECSRTRGCEHCCTLRQFGRTGRSNVGQSLARRPDECSVHVDVSISSKRETPKGGASKEVCKVASDQGVQVRNAWMSDWRSNQSRPTRHQDPT